MQLHGLLTLECFLPATTEKQIIYLRPPLTLSSHPLISDPWRHHYVIVLATYLVYIVSLHFCFAQSSLGNLSEVSPLRKEAFYVPIVSFPPPTISLLLSILGHHFSLFT